MDIGSRAVGPDKAEPRVVQRRDAGDDAGLVDAAHPFNSCHVAVNCAVFARAQSRAARSTGAGALPTINSSERIATEHRKSGPSI